METIHYNTRRDCVNYFLSNPKIQMDSEYEKSLFIVIANKFLDIMESATRGYEYETNWDGAIDDLYWDIWKPFINEEVLSKINLLEERLISLATTSTPTIIYQK